MAAVKWSDTSLTDIFEIGEYIGQSSPIMAEIVTSAILDAGDSLKDHPRRGRIIPEINIETSREIFYGTYRIMYDIVGDIVEIVTVIHGSRDFKPEEN